MKTAQFKSQKGFTLIELLVVIGILAVLLAITLIAINPGRQFSQANNTKRSSDVNAILNAVGQFAADNKGALPVGIPNSTATGPDFGSLIIQQSATPANDADICADLVTKYIAALPVDPLQPGGGTPVTNCAAAYNTNYRIVKNVPNNRITVSAPAAELSQTISVTR